jgi:hypothetical protein
MCLLLVRTKIAYEHGINVLESFEMDLSSYHLAGIRWTTNCPVKYDSLDTRDSLRDALSIPCSIRCSSEPVTKVDDWAGRATFSCSGLTIKAFVHAITYFASSTRIQKESACSTFEKLELPDLNDRICVFVAYQKPVLDVLSRHHE